MSNSKAVQVHFVSRANGPERLVTEAELHFDDGPLAADVTRYIEGIHFPALKHDVILAFRHNQAPDEVVARLHTIPVTEFRDLDHLKDEYDASRV